MNGIKMLKQSLKSPFKYFMTKLFHGPVWAGRQTVIDIFHVKLLNKCVII